MKKFDLGILETTYMRPFHNDKAIRTHKILSKDGWIDIQIPFDEEEEREIIAEAKTIKDRFKFETFLANAKLGYYRP